MRPLQMQRASTHISDRKFFVALAALMLAPLLPATRGQPAPGFGGAAPIKESGTTAAEETLPPIFATPQPQDSSRAPEPDVAVPAPQPQPAPPPAAAPQNSAPALQAPPVDTTEADNILRELVAAQKELFAQAGREGEALDQLDFQSQLQQLTQRYDRLLRRYADYAPAYVAYGLLLGKIGMRKEGAALMHKANELDDSLPVVKNQLGNYLAEEGRPLEALVFYTNAIALDPKEPLYPYQLGNLLFAARDMFLQRAPAVWTREKLDQYMQSSFREAMLLAPTDWRYAYRYGMSFYDLEKPDWDGALNFWQAFQTTLKPGIEQQVCQLHQARVLAEMGRLDEAQAAIGKVTAPELASQKASVAAVISERRQ